MGEKSARIGSPISRLPRLSLWFPTMEAGLRLSMQINAPKLEVFLFVFFPFRAGRFISCIENSLFSSCFPGRRHPLNWPRRVCALKGVEGLESEKVFTVYLAS